MSSGVGYIDLATAVRRSGRQVGHLRRRCKDEFLAAGTAELRTPPAGGKATWAIREDADPAFARVKAPELIGADLRDVPEDARAEAYRRLAILTEWDAAVAAGMRLRGFDKRAITNHFCERLLIDKRVVVCRATLYGWQAAYRRGGVRGLVDGRAGVGGKRADDGGPDPFLEAVKAYYLDRRKRTLAFCRELAVDKARDAGWAVRNYKACQRHVAAVPKAVALKLRGGEEDYVNEAEPYLERDYTTLASNELWCSDHHQFDVLVAVSERADGGTGELVRRHVRPWVTAWMDLRSRKIVGHAVFATDPNSDTVVSTFRAAVLDHGVPRSILIDNGKDYDCLALNGRTKRDRWAKRTVRVELDAPQLGVFPTLGVDVQHAQPYHGQSKPIERWFGTVEQRTTVWDTYCGSRPDRRPEDLQLNLERGKAPTLAEFADWFDDWVDAYNGGHAHAGQGMGGRTPDAVYAEYLTARRVADRALLDFLCLPQVGPVRVGQNGVTHKGLHYGQYAAELQRRLGQSVLLKVDPDDVSAVYVLTADGRFLCLATSNQQVPANAWAQTLRLAIADKRRSRRLLREYVDERPRIADDVPTRMLRKAQADAAAARAAEPARPGPTLQPVRSAFEGQLPALQRAMQREPTAIAVGAERTSLVDLADLLRPDAAPAPAADPFRLLAAKMRGDARD